MAMQDPSHKAKALFAGFCCTYIARRHSKGMLEIWMLEI